MLRTLVVALVIGQFSQTAVAMEKLQGENELTHSCEEFREELKNFTFAHTRSILDDSGSNSCTGYMANVLARVFLPYAIVADLASILEGTVKIPVFGTKVAFHAIKEGLRHIKSSLSKETDQYDLVKSYKKRLKQIEPYIGEHPSSATILVMMFAKTAFDSQEIAPDVLQIGTGKKIKVSSIRKLDEGSGHKASEIFEEVGRAAQQIKQYNIPEEALMKCILNGSDNENLNGIVKLLEKASATALLILPKILK